MISFIIMNTQIFNQGQFKYPTILNLSSSTERCLFTLTPESTYMSKSTTAAPSKSSMQRTWSNALLCSCCCLWDHIAGLGENFQNSRLDTDGLTQLLSKRHRGSLCGTNEPVRITFMALVWNITGSLSVLCPRYKETFFFLLICLQFTIIW